MRTIVALLFAALVALAATSPVKVDEHGVKYRVADKVFLEKQKNILRLFKYIFQHNQFEDQVEIAEKWHFEEHFEDFTHHKFVKEFVHFYKEGLLPRGEIFSIFNEVHREQAVSLFHVFYYAKNFETFYKVACWARDHVNEGMFVYAMHVAVLHRHDMQGFVLPPIYEIYPYFFVNSEVIDEAYKLKMEHNHHNKLDTFFHVTANFSGDYIPTNTELYDLSYFLEDPALNAFYYYFHVDYPFWMGGDEFGLKDDRRGEMYFWIHQQLLARYYMERLSFDYGTFEVFSPKESIWYGHVPSLRYPNGIEFPVRPAHHEVTSYPYNQWHTKTMEHNVWKMHEIEDYERRIRDAIDFGFVFTDDGTKINLYEEHGFDTLGKMIESNPDSPNTRFYGHLQILLRQVLGYAPYPTDEYKIAPSVLEHFETSLRDPIFFQMYKRITYFFLKYKSHLPHYTYTELHHPGIKIGGVTVDKLLTYFDRFEFDITNALYVAENEFVDDHFFIHVHQHRLNHKPFTYKVNVESDKPQEVVVRVFLGPKYDEFGHEIPLCENRFNFVEIDKFVHTLVAGKNIIERHSYETNAIKDRTTYRTLYKQVMSALKGDEEFHLDMSEAHNGFPNRFILPRGKEGGQVFQWFVHITPHKVDHKKVTYDSVISAGVGSGARYVDELPFGYPFDRDIPDEQTFFVPNSFVEDVIIFHKHHEPKHHH